MPGHADDDARFYDRQQLTSIYTLAGDSSYPPKTRIDYCYTLAIL